jgi:hypothetical protein
MSVHSASALLDASTLLCKSRTAARDLFRPDVASARCVFFCERPIVIALDASARR